jgi:hypothetical protein
MSRNALVYLLLAILLGAALLPLDAYPPVLRVPLGAVLGPLTVIILAQLAKGIRDAR